MPWVRRDSPRAIPYVPSATPAPIAAILIGATSRTESSKKRSWPGVWCSSDESCRISEPGAARQGASPAQDAAVAAAAAATPQRRPAARLPVKEDAALASEPTTMERPTNRAAARALDSCSRHLKPTKAPAPSAAIPAATISRGAAPGSSWPLMRAANESTTASPEE